MLTDTIIESLITLLRRLLTLQWKAWYNTLLGSSPEENEMYMGNVKALIVYYKVGNFIIRDITTKTRNFF